MDYRSCVLAMICLGSVHVSPALAQSTTWNNANTGSQAWSSASNWSSGIPDATTDAVFSGSFSASTTITNALDAFDVLTADASVNTGNTLSLQWINDGEGNGLSINASRGTVQLRPHAAAAQLTVNGAVQLTATETGSTLLNFSNRGNLVATGGVVLGAASGALASIHYSGVTNTASGIKGDVTFNNGSSIVEQNDVASTSVFTFDGDVLLKAGGYTGNAPTLNVGRLSATADGAKTKVTGALGVEAGMVRVYKGRTLEAGSLIVASSGTLQMRGFSAAANIGVVSTQGDFHLNGGTLDNNISGNQGASGAGYKIAVGGDFKLSTGSVVSLAEATSNTTKTIMTLAGNLEIAAENLGGGSKLNRLALELNGSEMQFLEAAVADGDDTFALYSLTLSDSGLYSLTNAYTNVGSDEYFQAFNLTNIGEAVLYLNGSRFFVGSTELTAGSYSNFGGNLTVISGAIPEPGAASLTGAGIIGLLLFLGRRGCGTKKIILA